MTTKIAAWGNSFGLRLPKSLLETFALKEGSCVNIEVQEDAILIRPARPTLKELVSRITPQNRHDEIDFGKPIGKEIW